jgi:lipopolysaccharide export system protein LptA
MSAQKASVPVRLVRLAAVVVFVALAAVIIERLAYRPGGPRPETVTPPPEGRVVDIKERVRHKEYKEGRPVVDARGQSFFRGPDGRNHLAGSVEIASLGPAGETVSRLTADEVVYDPGSLRFTVTGNVRVEAGGVVLEGDSFRYDKAQGLFETASGARFSSRTIAGSAPEIAYLESPDEIRLGGGFRAAFARAGETGNALTVSGQDLVYSRKERRGRVLGQADLRTGPCRGTSEAASFMANRDETALESAVLEGAARLALNTDRAAGRPESEIAAARIALTFSGRPPAVGSVEASGNVVLALRSPEGRAIRLATPAAALKLARDGEPVSWTASGGIVADLDEPSRASFTLEGETASFEASNGFVRVRRWPDRPAVAESADIRVEADEISSRPGLDDLRAFGGVDGLLRPGERGPAPGFFSPTENVSILCDRLIWRGRGSEAAFEGNVRARQGANLLRAEELVFDRRTGDMRGRGGVAAELDQAAAGDAVGRRVELGGQEMAWMSTPRSLDLSGKAYVQLPEARLEARKVSAVLGRGGSAVESLEASSDVSVAKGRYGGRAEAASYQAATRTVMLTGRPVLTDGKGGSAKGSKLTFDLADDKILIENEGQGRATTVVRS